MTAADTPAPRCIVGLDLGQAADFTALAAIQANGMDDKQRTIWGMPLLERWHLGTSYLDIVRDVRAVCAKLSKPILVVDGTGVGRAVVDQFREANLSVSELAPITITAGHTVNCSANGITVPKKDLVAAVQAVLQSRRLKIAKALKEATTLTKELATFRVKINTASATESFEAWRTADHDDLVLATALAVWHGETVAPANCDLIHISRIPEPEKPRYREPSRFPCVRPFPQLGGYQPWIEHGGQWHWMDCFTTEDQAAYALAFARRRLGLPALAFVETPVVQYDLDDSPEASGRAIAAIEKTVLAWLAKNKVV